MINIGISHINFRACSDVNVSQGMPLLLHNNSIIPGGQIRKSNPTIFVNPLPDDKFLDSSKLKEFADHNFSFDENGRKLFKGVENTVGKGEIACYDQFLLFPQCFQKACFPGASKGVIVWEWIKFRSIVSFKILIPAT